MKRGLLLLVAGFLALPTWLGADTVFKSKAEEITLTGRVQAQWRHSTVDGDPSNEFMIRRARATLKVKINDWFSGVVQPDFAGSKLSLKDAYAKMKLGDNLSVITGQTKRPFDLFELTSSTKILVIERDGRIGRMKIPTLSSLTAGLGYADRDIGVFGSVHDGNKRFRLDFGVTNGSGTSAAPSIGEKAFQGRVAVKPVEDRPFRVMGGISARPYETEFAGSDSAEVEYATAFEGSVEYGKWSEGAHVQAGVVVGDNWDGSKGFTSYDPTTDFAMDPPTFFAVQGIVTWKQPLANNRWFESVEPLVRVSFADPNTDVDNDGGLLVTPGINVFTKTRNRVSVNVDIFVPQDDALDTDASVKAQSWVYW